MLKFDRRELLGRLMAVEPGTTKKDTIQQSSCLVLKRGRLYTLNREVACSLAAGFPADLEGAVPFPKLLNLLKELPDEEIAVDIKDAFIIIKGKGHRTKVPIDRNIVLPIDFVEIPKADQWQKLEVMFPEAVDVVRRCTKKRADFANTCVHIHPQWLEACDDVRMARYAVPTFVRASVLVRAESLKGIVQLGMTKAAETESWIHFWNPMGLRYSIRKFAVESYPPLDEFLDLRGTKIVLPRSMANMAVRAGIMATDDNVLVKIENNTLLVSAACEQGEHVVALAVKYAGPKLVFVMPYRFVPDLLEQNTEVEITPASMRVNGGRYIFVSGLEMVEDQ